MKNLDDQEPLLFPLYLLEHLNKDSLCRITQHLIELGIEIDATDKDGWNLLHNLCKTYSGSDFVERIELATTKFGIPVNSISTSKGCNALHFLMKKIRGTLEPNRGGIAGINNVVLFHAVMFLVNNGIDIKCEDNEGRIPLFNLFEGDNVSRGSPPLVITNKGFLIKITEILLQQEPRIINATDKRGMTILHILCHSYYGSDLVDLLKLFINKKTQINAVDKRGFNALHHLFQNIVLGDDDLKIAVMVLIENGIDAKCEDNTGRNPLFYMIDHYKWKDFSLTTKEYFREVTDLLIHEGVDVNATDKKGENILHRIVANKYTNTSFLDYLNILIDKGIELNVSDKKGLNALHHLCNWSWHSVQFNTDILFDAAKILMKNGIIGLEVGSNFVLGEEASYLLSFFRRHKSDIEDVQLTAFKAYVNNFRGTKKTE